MYPQHPSRPAAFLSSQRKHTGFTLIELMIVVAVIAILAAIAIPNYQEYVTKSRRAAAQSFLMDVMQRQQQYLLDAREYAADLATLGMSTPDDVGDFYTLNAFDIDGPPPTVVITLTAKGAQAGDGNLSLSSTGAKTGKW